MNASFHVNGTPARREEIEGDVPAERELIE